MKRAHGGLALAAGGARGAYQAGALLYFAEQGVVFDAVAASSIGTLNGAYYTQGDGSAGHLAGLCELWRAIPQAGVLQVSGRAAVTALTTLVLWKTPWLVGVSVFLQANQLALLDPRPIAALLDRWLDYGRICSSPISLTVAALPSWGSVVDIVTAPWRNATYFRAHELGPIDLRAALLAATAIPLAFPPQAVGARSYSDAGITDPLPAQVLYRRGARWIVSIFLSNDTVQSRADFAGCVLLQVRPSVAIDPSLFTTFDFSRGLIDRLIDLGYEDARTNWREPQELCSWLMAREQSGRRRQALADRLRRSDEKSMKQDRDLI